MLYTATGMRRLLGAALCLLAFAAWTAEAKADAGIRLLAAKRLDARLSELTMSTPVLAAPVHVR